MGGEKGREGELRRGREEKEGGSEKVRCEQGRAGRGEYNRTQKPVLLWPFREETLSKHL